MMTVVVLLWSLQEFDMLVHEPVLHMLPALVTVRKKDLDLLESKTQGRACSTPGEETVEMAE